MNFIPSLLLPPLQTLLHAKCRTSHNAEASHHEPTAKAPTTQQKQHSRLDYCRKPISTHNKVGALVLADFLLWKRSVLQRQHQGCSSPLNDQMAHLQSMAHHFQLPLLSILSWYKPPDFKFTVHPKYPFKIFPKFADMAFLTHLCTFMSVLIQHATHWASHQQNCCLSGNIWPML